MAAAPAQKPNLGRVERYTKTYSLTRSLNKGVREPPPGGALFPDPTPCLQGEAPGRSLVAARLPSDAATHYPGLDLLTPLTLCDLLGLSGKPRPTPCQKKPLAVRVHLFGKTGGREAQRQSFAQRSRDLGAWN